MSEMIQLDHDHTLQFIGNGTDPRVGAMIQHRCTNGIRSSYIGLNPNFNTPAATWQVESWDPLTLSPSLACTRCNDHGFIREGRWEPA